MRIGTFDTIRNIIKFISALLVFALIAGLILYLARHTDNFTEEYSSIYLELNGKDISKSGEISIELNKEYSFEVKSQTLFSADYPLYTVKVVPNISEDTKFAYYVDYEPYIYNSSFDFTECFIKSYTANGFRLKAEKDLPEMMKDLYSEKTVSDVPSVVDSDYSYFTLVVSADKTEIKVNLHFSDTSSEVVS